MCVVSICGEKRNSCKILIWLQCYFCWFCVCGFFSLVFWLLLNFAINQPTNQPTHQCELNANLIQNQNNNICFPNISNSLFFVSELIPFAEKTTTTTTKQRRRICTECEWYLNLFFCYCFFYYIARVKDVISNWWWWWLDQFHQKKKNGLNRRFSIGFFFLRYLLIWIWINFQFSMVLSKFKPGTAIYRVKKFLFFEYPKD